MRRVKIYTGTGGMDLFEEVFEAEFGIYRIHAGKKVMRILKKYFKKQSHTGKYFKYTKTKQRK